jgi:hypothetical protein
MSASIEVIARSSTPLSTACRTSACENAVARQNEVPGYSETVEITEAAWKNLLRVSDFVGIIDQNTESSACETVVDNSFAQKAKENVDAE